MKGKQPKMLMVALFIRTASFLITIRLWNAVSRPCRPRPRPLKGLFGVSGN
jgi:hypothetical protein